MIPSVSAMLLAIPAGCSAGGVDAEPAPLRARATFGSSGRSLGQFQYPRGLAVDPKREVMYVVDKTGRVQRWGFDGEPQLQWQMPRWDNGKPTGLGVSPDGNVFVADTHCHRVMAFGLRNRNAMGLILVFFGLIYGIVMQWI